MLNMYFNKQTDQEYSLLFNYKPFIFQILIYQKNIYIIMKDLNLFLDKVNLL